MRFRTTVKQGGKTATGLVIPEEVMSELGAGKRPKVAVTVGGHTYRTTVGVMGGVSLVPLSAENREAAQVVAGDEVDIELVLDEVPRDVDLPEDLAAAIGVGPAKQFFDSLAASYRKEWVRWVTEAKKPETRTARIDKTVAGLTEGRKTH